MTTFNETDLRSHFESTGGKHLKNMPPADYYEKMIELIEKRNYLQILYGMGYKYLLILMDFFDEREEYDKCSLILSTIHNHNKISGDNLNTSLCEELSA